MEKLIPISRMQHQTIATLNGEIAKLQERLSVVASVMIQGANEEIANAQIVGPRHVPAKDDGQAASGEAFYLVLELPDITPARDTAA